MILSCKSCEKKFVVPDNAIGASGRLVQCSSCGNKWKQFPIITEFKENSEKIEIKPIQKNIKKTIKKKIKQKKDGPNLYTPEYLAKKHGIKINENVKFKQKNLKKKSNHSFGFYNLLLILTVFTIFILRILYFFQDIIIVKFPYLKIYINYLFESIENIKEIILNFFLGY
tara:strand:+ start:61 stop:570 length:510 start_codon:yes stop_codon:yes gene_type:complete